jgi:hypothetical protein
MTESIAFKHAMLCDDVRREDNGKLIVIGLYAGNIQLSSFPASLALSLLCEFITNSDRPIQCEIGISFQLNGEASTKGTIGVTIDGRGTSHLAFPRAPLKIVAPGKLEIFLTIPSQKDILAWSGDVVQLNPPTALTTS